MPSPAPKSLAPAPPKATNKTKTKNKRAAKTKRTKSKSKPNRNIKNAKGSKVKKHIKKSKRIKKVKSGSNQKKLKSNTMKKYGFSIRLNPKLFQQYDTHINIGKGKNNSYNKPPTKKTTKTKNLKPSLIKKKKKSTANKPKPKPKKLEFNLFEKRKSAMIIKTNPKTKTPRPNLKFSKSADINNNSTQQYILPELFCFKQSKSKPLVLQPSTTNLIFNINDINKKTSKPEDYNEIQYKTVDAMEFKRQQKKKVGTRFMRTTQMVTNKPPKNSNNKIKTTPKPNANPTAKPTFPPAPPPKPKTNSKTFKTNSKKGTVNILKQDVTGVLEVMPNKKAHGWIYTKRGMFRVSFSDINDIKNNNIYEGSPVIFDSIDKTAQHLRLVKQIDSNVIAQCMSEKGNTKHDARYYIYDTQFEFNGNLSCNAFEMLNGECDGTQLGKMSEKIINAFINTNGGILYIGIDKTWTVKGVLAKSIDLDRIEQFVMLNVHRFEPKLNGNDLRKFKFTTTAIVGLDGVLCEDIFIIKVIVPGPFKDENNDMIMYSTGNGDRFKKNLNYITKVIM